MAERINWKLVDVNDPRFFEADPENPNTNISGSRFDPTDPTADVENPASASARYNQFLQTANVGDTFDFGDGTKNQFVGFNKMGTPIIQTIESDARTNWRDTMSGAKSFADAVGKLEAAGFDSQMAQFLASKSGTGFSDQGNYMATNTATSIGAMADGTPIYGYGSDGKPVTSPTGTIYSTTSASDAINKFNSGASPLSTVTSPIKPTVIPGSTGFSTTDGQNLAVNVFKNTLALFFGPAEMTKPWVNELYKTVSGFTKSGSTPEEAFNMAVLESENKPEMADFVKRFKGIFALQKMKQEGKAVTVPTVAEYFATESKMGDILKASNLGSLANEDFLGDVLSKGINATQFGDRIVDIFDRIDTAPDAIKKTISRFFPTLDRVQLAKALALGDKGAKQLQQELAGYEVLSAAEQQGLGVSATLPGGITNARAQQIAKGGGTFASTLGQFGQIAGARETEQKLAEISGMKSLGVSGLTSAVIDKSAAELKKLEDLTRQEEARFAAKAGTIGSKSLASQSRANRVI